MKTLIFYGSPLKDSHTMALVKEMTNVLEGDIKLVDCYRVKVSPCIDCKYCFKKKGCSIQDDMQEIYDYVEDCDNIIIASPMHFGTLTAPLLTVCSRLQSYWSSRHIRTDNKDIIKSKHGVLLITTGGNWVNMNLLAEGIADFIFDHTQTEQIGSVYAKETDQNPAKDNEKAKEKAVYLAQRLNQLCNQ